MNLLQETIKAIEPRTPADVRWVGSGDFWFTWDEFAAIANVEYDQGYGASEVATDLLVVGKNWWLERHEYDGSEWWEEKSMPKKPTNHKKPSALVVGQCPDSSCGWQKMRELNPEPSPDAPKGGGK